MRPNVLLIAIDSLRSDHLDAVHTPNLEALVEDSLYFPNCLVTEPRTGSRHAASSTKTRSGAVHSRHDRNV